MHRVADGDPAILIFLCALFALAACAPSPSTPEVVARRAAVVGAACDVSTPCGDVNQVCVASKCVCANGYFGSVNAVSCTPCHSSCATCSGPTEDDCTSCAPTSVLAFDVGDACTTNADCANLAIPNSGAGVCTGNVCAFAGCQVGYYVSGSATCTACTAPPGCASGLTCTNASDQTCATCGAGYAGSSCQYADATTCHGHGTAQSDGSCVCAAGYTGAGCDSCASNYYNYPTCAFCDAGTTCNGHGTCDSAGACACAPGFAGPNCASCGTGFFEYPTCTACDAATACNGHGICDSQGACVCNAGFAGAACNICAPNRVGYPSCVPCGPGQYFAGGVCRDCSACPAGQYVSIGCSGTSDVVCAACEPIAGCVSPITCAGFGRSQCTACAPGLNLDDSLADSCSPCSPIANCSSVTCTSPAASTCLVCDPGHVWRNGACAPCAACPSGQYASATCPTTTETQCSPCSAIVGCSSTLTCTGATDSQCATCGPGRYLNQGAADVCSSCQPIAGCTSEVTCTSATDSTCTACRAGTYLAGGQCATCSGVCPAGQYQSAECTATADRLCSACESSCLTCADASRCTGCQTGEYLASDGRCRTCGCDRNATCTSGQGMPVCTCNQGYMGDGRVCAPVCPASETLCGVACVALADDGANCGECGKVCSDGANALGRCVNSACMTDETCAEGYANCKNDVSGCETPINTTADCGACGVSCGGVVHGKTICIDGRCDVSSCDGGFGDCDGNGGNGCEASLLEDPGNCGTCGTRCDGGAACVAGRCAKPTCAPGFADCDPDVFGCETDTRTFSNCGGCGAACSAVARGVVGCSQAGTCEILACDTGYRSGTSGGSPACITCGDVDDGDACTLDSCGDTGTAIHPRLSAAQLDDQNPCTVDSCSKFVGAQHVARPGANCGLNGTCNASGQCVTEAPFVPMAPAVTIGQPDEVQLTIPARTMALVTQADGTTRPLTSITITPTDNEPPRAAIPLMSTGVSQVVELGPSGATFSQPIEVSLIFDRRTTTTPTGMVICSDRDPCTTVPVRVQGNVATGLVSHFSTVFLIARQAAPRPDGGAPSGDGSAPSDGGAPGPGDSGAADSPEPVEAGVEVGADATTAMDAAMDGRPGMKDGGGGCSCRTGGQPLDPSGRALLVVALIVGGLFRSRRRSRGATSTPRQR